MLSDDAKDDESALARGGIVGPVRIPVNDGCIVPHGIKPPERFEIRLGGMGSDLAAHIIPMLREAVRRRGGGWMCPDDRHGDRAQGRTLNIPAETVLALANRWEPEASASPPGYRRATCVNCAQPMVAMWHIWLADGGFKKEIHMCWDCALPWLS